MTPCSRDEINSIEIRNTYGTYKLCAFDYTVDDATTKSYYIEGARGTSLDSSMVSGVIVYGGKPIASLINGKEFRANDMATKADLKSYGLDEESNPSSYTVYKEDGTSFTIIIGDEVAVGTGHYVMLDDESRRNVVTDENGVTTSYYIIYVLDSTSSEVLLASKTSLISLLICDYVGSGIYSLSDFEFFRYNNGEKQLVVQIGPVDTAESLSSVSFELKYPAAYTLDIDGFYDNVLQNLQYLYATEIVEVGDNMFIPSVYESYGLDLDEERLSNSTDTNYMTLYYKCLGSDSESEYDNLLYISKPMLEASGTYVYYIYSPSKQLIAKLDTSSLEFLSWTTADFSSERLFFESIASLDYLSLSSSDGKTDVKYVFSGSASSYHVDTETNSGKTIVGADGKPITFDIQENPDGFENFRNLYYTLITRTFDSEYFATLSTKEGEEAKYKVEISMVGRDTNATYVRYENGNKMYDSSGNTVYAEYEGGYLIVSNLTGETAGGTKLSFERAYYDEETNQYFVKEKDSDDGEIKPSPKRYDDEGNLIPLFKALVNTTAEYTVEIHTFEFYNLYTTVKNDDGTETERVSQTYMIVVPSVTTTTYTINPDGSRTLKSSVTEKSFENGCRIRTVVIEKLFSDSEKLLNGITIDVYSAE